MGCSTARSWAAASRRCCTATAGFAPRRRGAERGCSWRLRARNRMGDKGFGGGRGVGGLERLEHLSKGYVAEIVGWLCWKAFLCCSPGRQAPHLLLPFRMCPFQLPKVAAGVVPALGAQRGRGSAGPALAGGEAQKPQPQPAGRGVDSKRLELLLDLFVLFLAWLRGGLLLF